MFIEYAEVIAIDKLGNCFATKAANGYGLVRNNGNNGMPARHGLTTVKAISVVHHVQGSASRGV